MLGITSAHQHPSGMFPRRLPDVDVSAPSLKVFKYLLLRGHVLTDGRLFVHQIKIIYRHHNFKRFPSAFISKELIQIST